MERVINCMEPILLLCRLADGQKPVIFKLYGTQLYVSEQIEQSDTTAGMHYCFYYHPPISHYPSHNAGAGSVEEKIRDMFLSRWSEIQSPIILSSRQPTYSIHCGSLSTLIINPCFNIYHDFLHLNTVCEKYSYKSQNRNFSLNRL